MAALIIRRTLGSLIVFLIVLLILYFRPAPAGARPFAGPA
jgi:hypothetical protein